MTFRYPGGKQFAFTVFDDTDNARTSNIKPVYDLLADCGLRTTKSVWVYPPRGGYVGDCLLDLPYRKFIQNLQSSGFEIALHNVGDGVYLRPEIASGIDTFKEILGIYPKCHTNHVSNPDNLYWWDQRFEWPISALYKMYRLISSRTNQLGGEDPNSEYFWGDISKERIKYIRNLTFNGINTLSFDPLMPYKIKRKKEYSNYWFSSSDGHSIREFNDLVNRKSIDRLEAEGGLCIVYTHFASGFVDSSGIIDLQFKKNIEYLSSKSGYFVPVSDLLDYVLLQRGGDSFPGYPYLLKRNLLWLWNRFVKRFRHNK